MQNFFLELNLKENNYVCKFCVNKLNRLVRIGDDIRNKLETLHEKRNELFNELKRTVASKTQLRTPVNRKRERQKNTPTPRKPKVRRLLPFHNSPRAREPVLFKPRTERTSEEATELCDEQVQPINNGHTGPNSTKDVCTQTTSYHEKDLM